MSIRNLDSLGGPGSSLPVGCYISSRRENVKQVSVHAVREDPASAADFQDLGSKLETVKDSDNCSTVSRSDR